MAKNWVEIGIGFWLLASPWLLGFSSISIMKWGNLLSGLALVLLNVWAVFGQKRSAQEKQ